MRFFSASLGARRVLLVLILFMVLTDSMSVRLVPHQLSSHEIVGAHEGHQQPLKFKGGPTEKLGMELYPSGSSLPDCSHACGSCFPCKRVMVSIKCSVAESCPIVYRCMCRGKYYHVPSN
ncbi:hypothetical protein RJ641_031711 [Dillenia turbinata]|uniref:Epidermal patterning factor-like protein n=1 Tax=Dillenia turbinata TaxID=194707 RepID=A0AAN8W1G5_9MAGN